MMGRDNASPESLRSLPWPCCSSSPWPGPEEPHIAGSRPEQLPLTQPLKAKAIFCSPATSCGSRVPAPGLNEAGWAGAPHLLPPKLDFG